MRPFREGQGSEAVHQWLIAAVRQVWCGNPSAGPAEYVDWIVGNAHLRLPADVTRLRRGLRLTGLPT